MRFSKTDAPALRPSRSLTGRPRALPERLVRPASETVELAPPAPLPHPEAELASHYRIEPLVRERLLELQVRGHTTYVMVMRYVHLDKGDLYRDFETCAPF